MAEPGGLGAGALLWRLGLAPAWRGLRRSRWGERLRLGAFALGFAVFESLLHGVFRPVTRFLYAQEDLGPLLMGRVLALFFSFLLVFLALSSLLSLLSRLFLAAETSLLVPTPVSESAFFRFRALQACGAACGMLLPLWLPFAHALRSAMGAPYAWELWAAAAPLPLGVLVFAGAGLALRALLTLIDARRLRRILGLLLLALGLALVFWVRWQQPESLADPAKAGNAAAYLKGLQRADLDWWPPVWAARAVMLAHGRFAEALQWWALLCACAASAWWLLERSFAPRVFALWQSTQELGEGAGRSAGAAVRGLRWWRRPGVWQALAQKEWAAFWRHPGQRLQALILAALMLLFAMNLARLPDVGDPGLWALLFLPVCAFAQLVLVAVASRFAYPSASLEAQGAWMVGVSPPGAAAQLRLRLILHGVLLSLLSALLACTVFHVFHPRGAPAWLAAGLFAAAGPAAACLAVGLGAAWSKPTDGGPDDVVSSPAGVLAMALGAAFVVGQCALAAVPLAEAYRLGLSQKFKPNYLAFIAPGLLWLGALTAATAWPLRSALRKLKEEA